MRACQATNLDVVGQALFLLGERGKKMRADGQDGGGGGGGGFGADGIRCYEAVPV